MTRTPIDSPSPLATQKLEYGPAREGLRWVGKYNMTRRSRYFLESLPWPRGSSLVFGVREFVSPSPPSLWFNQISSNLWGRWPCGNINHYVIHWRSILGLPLYLRHGHIATRGFEVLRLFEFKLRRGGRNSTLRTILRSEFGRFLGGWRFPGHPKYGKREGFEFSAHDLFVARCFFKRNYSITEKTANGDCR